MKSGQNDDFPAYFCNFFQFFNFRPFLRKISLFVLKAHKLFFWYLSESYRNQYMNFYRFSNLQCVDSFIY